LRKCVETAPSWNWIKKPRKWVIRITGIVVKADLMKNSQMGAQSPDAMLGALFASLAKRCSRRRLIALSLKFIRNGGAMKISRLIFQLMAPWRECEMCFLGPGILYVGDELELLLGLFFIQIGIALKRREHESDSQLHY
jgi:hypothetical protein